MNDDLRDLERLFSYALDLLAIADFQGRFRRVNPAFVALLGFSEEELLSRPFLDYVHPEDLNATLGELTTLSAGAPTVSFENRYRCVDGSWRWLSWRAMPDPAAGVIYAVARDVTAARAAAQELADRESRLRVLVAREARDRGRAEVAAGILHDLGNALTGITARATDAQAALRAATSADELPRALRFVRTQRAPLSVGIGEAKADALADLLDAVNRSVQRSRTELNDNLARLSTFAMHAQDLIASYRSLSGAGSAQVDRHESVASLLAELEAMSADVVADAGGALEIIASPDVRERTVDSARTLRALLNAVHNSVEAFTASGPRAEGESLRVVVRATIQSDGAVRLEVVDNGPGFDGDGERLFADRVTTRARGSGLGLGAARRAVAAIGGTVGLESDGVGKGARFWVAVPMRGGTRR